MGPGVGFWVVFPVVYGGVAEVADVGVVLLVDCDVFYGCFGWLLADWAGGGHGWRSCGFIVSLCCRVSFILCS